jgi:hypothetical protein
MLMKLEAINKNAFIAGIEPGQSRRIRFDRQAQAGAFGAH